jgi:hypothetical protein
MVARVLVGLNTEQGVRKVSFTLLMVAWVILEGCANQERNSGGTASEEGTNFLVGAWHLVSLDMPTNTWGEFQLQFPDANVEFTSRGTYFYLAQIAFKGKKSPMYYEGKWSLSNGVLRIDIGTFFSGETNVMTRVRVADGKLILEKDVFTYPFSIASVYERTNQWSKRAAEKGYGE